MARCAWRQVTSYRARAGKVARFVTPVHPIPLRSSRNRGRRAQSPGQSWSEISLACVFGMLDCSRVVSPLRKAIRRARPAPPSRSSPRKPPRSPTADGSSGRPEPVHGTAPDIAGRNIANPLAQILSVAMMFRHSFDQPERADRIHRAVGAVLREGYRTADIFQPGMRRVGTRRDGQRDRRRPALVGIQNRGAVSPRPRSAPENSS